MSGFKGATFANQLLQLVFNAVAIPNLADNAASAPLTNLYIALHVNTVVAGSSQNTNEASYTSYVRVPVVRTSVGWTVAGEVASNASAILFAPNGGGSSQTVSYASVGTASSGPGEILYAGPLTAPLVVTPALEPAFLAGALTFTDT